MTTLTSSSESLTTRRFLGPFETSTWDAWASTGADTTGFLLADLHGNLAASRRAPFRR